jgi:hypothetical protein
VNASGTFPEMRCEWKKVGILSRGLWGTSLGFVFGFGLGNGWLWIFGSLNPLVNRHFPHEIPMNSGNGNFFIALP